VERLVRHHAALVTVEQGAMLGFGAIVLQHLAAAGALDGRCQIRTMTLPDRFIDQGSPAQMYQWAGLTAADIAATARQALNRDPARLRLV
jgi:1-deoxy-D-xylulose-5-phosphate synthase